jgi:hypothetical protein
MLPCGVAACTCSCAWLFIAGDSSQKLRRLGRELRDLRGKTKLPVAAAAACFVIQDADRTDKVSCTLWPAVPCLSQVSQVSSFAMLLLFLKS